MRLTQDGFELEFTKPVNKESASRPEAWSFTHYYYLYHSTYGSPKTGETPVKVTAVEVSEDGKKVRLTLEKLVPGRVFDLRPSGILSADGEDLCTRQAAYTVNRLR
jgi:DNA polymerase IIIc chi subunit